MLFSELKPRSVFIHKRTNKKYIKCNQHNVIDTENLSTLWIHGDSEVIFLGFLKIDVEDYFKEIAKHLEKFDIKKNETLVKIVERCEVAGMSAEECATHITCLLTNEKMQKFIEIIVQ